MEGQESMKDESQQIKMFKARNAMTEHKLKPWQEVGGDNESHTRAVMGIDAQVRGERARLECKPYMKSQSKIQRKTNDMLSHLGTEILMISIFRIGRSVMEAFSSFEMLQHANSL